VAASAAALAPLTRRRRAPPRTIAFDRPAGGKGFGAAPPQKKPKKLTDDIGASAGLGTPAQQSELLTQLLSEEEARKEAKAEMLNELRERDAYVAEKGVEAARVPDAVANRMITRMALFGGLPVFGGIGVFVWFYLQATKSDNVFQPTAVAAATTVPWVLGLFGIGFGALSASWDEDEPGSALGFAEIQLNVGRLLDGVKRSAKDEMLRTEVAKSRELQRDISACKESQGQLALLLDEKCAHVDFVCSFLHIFG